MEDNALINNLNDHCLKHIFSFLPILDRLEFERVCSRWYKITEGEWNDIKELTIHENLSDDTVYSILERCGCYVRKLKIFYAPEHSHCLSMTVEFCQLDQLEEIELINIDFKESDVEYNIRNLREIFEKSENLVAVTLKGNLCHDMLDYLNFLNPIPLRKLYLVNRSDRGSLIDPDRFPKLKELYLHDVDIIEDEETIREEDSLKGLEIMDIGRCEVAKNFIQRIWTFTNLQVLGLRHHLIGIKNEDIRNIARHCDKIKEMSLRNRFHPTSDCFQYLGQMPSLEILNFDMFTMNTRDLAYLTNVKKLSFQHCPDVVKGDKLIKLIENSSNLEELKFIKTRVLGRPFLNDVERIFQHGKRNKRLTIIIKGRDCERLNDLEKAIYHPLIDLRVDNHVGESDNNFYDDMYEDGDKDDCVIS